MILMEKLFRDIAPLLPDQRLFPEFLPENEPYPSAVYQRVGGINEGTACREDETARVHIMVYATTLSEAMAWARRIQAALRETGDYIAEQDSAPDSIYLYDLKAFMVELDYLLSEY